MNRQAKFGRYDGQDSYHIIIEEENGQASLCKSQNRRSVADSDELNVSEKERLEEFFYMCPDCREMYSEEMDMTRQELVAEIRSQIDSEEETTILHTDELATIYKRLRGFNASVSH